MLRMRQIAAALVLVLASGLPNPAPAADEMKKHSGTIISLDEAKGVIVIAEVGPWQRQDGNTVITQRRINVTDVTEWALVKRAEKTPSGFPQDFVEVELDRWEFLPGDFVTVHCVHRGRTMTATKISVVELATR